MKTQRHFILRATICALAIFSLWSNLVPVSAAGNYISVRVICNFVGVANVRVQLVPLGTANNPGYDFQTDRRGFVSFKNFRSGTYDIVVTCGTAMFTHTIYTGLSDFSHDYLFRCCPTPPGAPPGPNPDDGLIGVDGRAVTDAVTAGSRAASNAKVSSTTQGGLRVVTFDTLQGRVIVNLPDDMRAGDTISGTVVAEPKGQNDEERDKNMSAMGDQKTRIATAKKPDGTSDVNVDVTIATTSRSFTFKLPPSSTPTPPLTNVSSISPGGLGITLTNTSGSLSTGGTTTIPIEMNSLSLQSVAPLKTFQLPTIGQQGRTDEIRGPFDGNAANTECKVGGQSVKRLAESPRKLVFESPINVTGLTDIVLREGNVETKGEYRSVGIKLSATTTTLPKGGSATVTGVATGVGGSQKPIPIHVKCTGQVDMAGGNDQTLEAPPSSDPNAKFFFNLQITATKGEGPFAVFADVEKRAVVMGGPDGIEIRFPDGTSVVYDYGSEHDRETVTGPDGKRMQTRRDGKDLPPTRPGLTPLVNWQPPLDDPQWLEYLDEVAEAARDRVKRDEAGAEMYRKEAEQARKNGDQEEAKLNEARAKAEEANAEADRIRADREQRRADAVRQRQKGK